MNIISMILTAAALATSILVGYLYSQVKKSNVREHKHEESSGDELNVVQSGEEHEKDGEHKIDDQIEKMMETTDKFALRLSYQKIILLDKILMVLFIFSYT